jgi:hypothetical protein
LGSVKADNILGRRSSHADQNSVCGANKTSNKTVRVLALEMVIQSYGIAATATAVSIVRNNGMIVFGLCQYVRKLQRTLGKIFDSG